MNRAERRNHVNTASSEKRSYPFVRYSLVVSVLISLCSSLLGVTPVLKRFSFICDGLSHAAFGAMAIAAFVIFSVICKISGGIRQ